MRKVIIGLIIFIAILWALSNFSYMREAAEALDEAHKALDEGDYEEYEYWHSLAHNRISHMIITNIIYIFVIVPLIYAYHKSRMRRK
jgi:Na+/H+ antiporter NhaC